VTARKQFLLRIDPELWRELERWAADDLRSVNAQIEWLLREAVRRRTGKSSAAADAASAESGSER
jgi:hypothetical protein